MTQRAHITRGQAQALCYLPLDREIQLIAVWPAKGKIDRRSGLVSIALVLLAALMFLIVAVPSWHGDTNRHSLQVLSIPVSVVLDMPGAVFAVAAGEAFAVVVAGVMTAVAGVMPAAGDIAGAAGVASVAGAVAIVAGTVAMAAGFAGDVAGADGGVWLKEVSARVKKQRLAISNVFIG